MKKLTPTIRNYGEAESFFTETEFSLTGDSQRMLSAQIPAINFRLRTSDSNYNSGWHVAGDPTLLVVLSGVFRVILRNGEYQDFSTGEMFIAEDYLAEGVEFNDAIHGHRAEVVGESPISVLHLKLEKRM